MSGVELDSHFSGLLAVAQAHSLAGNDGVLGLAPIRLHMHTALCINLMSLFVVINRVSVQNHRTIITTVTSRRAHDHFNISS
jgi:hypothetical protein